MDLYLNAEDHRRGLARALYEKIREAIAEGRIRPGDRLPPSRDLAKQLAISRFTVTTAYGFLIAEGFLEGASGAGTRVALESAASPLASKSRPRQAADLQRANPAHPGTSEAKAAPSAVKSAPTLHVELGIPDAASFPYGDFRRQTWRAMREIRAAGGAQYGDPAGDAVLRSAIAAWIHRSRGVRATAEQVVVTAGAQQAFD